uniref:LO6b n=1 Tax=Havana anole adomavirus TaxID=2609869 RepID=A0A6F9FCT8_9VIRU|nr:TPA_asm: LO6b [Havana anole adomavirus]
MSTNHFAASHLLTYMPPGLKMILLRGVSRKGSKKPWVVIDGHPFDIPDKLAVHILDRIEGTKWSDSDSGSFSDTHDNTDLESDIE